MKKSTCNPFKTIKYLAIPYKHNGDTFDGCDCYGLIALIYREELGITIQPFKMYESYRAVDEDVFVDHAQDEFAPVNEDALQPYDAILLYTDRKFPTHVGMYIGQGRFIHTRMRSKRPVVERLSVWRDRVYAFYRHKGLT